MPQPAQRSITWRSLLLGTICVIGICIVVPMNDLVFSDTSLAMGFLPLAIVLVEFLLVVALNAPLCRWAPRAALSSGELSVIVLMSLIACGLPNWGLMRFLIPMPVVPFHMGQSDETFWKAFKSMNLPEWLYPVPITDESRSSDVVRFFYQRTPEGEVTPYSAWIRPLLHWAIFIAGMLLSLIAMSRLVLKQWAVNERLPFPLVQVQAALIETPPPGRAFNDLFRSPALWISLGAVFCVLILTCLNAYYPKYFPTIPLKYDLSGILSEEPFSFLRAKLKKSTISFAVVGVTFFIRSKAAFSLWAFFLLGNLVDMQYGMMRGEMPPGAWQDQNLGACAAFILAIFWIGRHYWLSVIKAAFGLGKERGGAVSFWCLILGIVLMLGWLKTVGVQLWVAGFVVMFTLAAHLVVSRVVAETGLPIYRCGILVTQLFSIWPVTWFTLRDIFFSLTFHVLGPVTTRDSIPTLAMHGQGICANSGVSGKSFNRLGAVMAWVLIVGFVVAASATLYCQYNFPTPGTAEVVPQRNYFGAEYAPKRDITAPFTEFSRSGFTGRQHNQVLQMGIGFGVTSFLEFASLRWASWPLLPVGYVASYGAFVENAWFSIFIGWLAQVLVVRLGGATLFQKARPVFIGLIFGECLAAGAWLIVNVIIVLNGGESQAVKFLL